VREHKMVDEKECKQIRDLYQDGLTLKKVSNEVGRGYRTVRRHIKGICPHPASTDLVESVGDKRSNTSHKISKEECIEIKETTLENGSMSEIVADYEYTYNTIRKHVVGECSHDTDGVLNRVVIKPVSAEMCSAMRYLYTQEYMTVDEIAELSNIKVGAETVKYHAVELCKH